MSILRSVSFFVAAVGLSLGCSSNGSGPSTADDVPATTTDVPHVDAGGLTDHGAATDQGPATDHGLVVADSGAACGATLGDCNVVTNAGCAAGQGCYAGRNANGGVGASCAEAGSHGWGEACTTANGCREGFACLGTPGACVKLCCGTDNASCRDQTHGGRAGAICAGGVNGSDVSTCMDVATCNAYVGAGNGCPADHPRCDVIASDGTANCFAQDTAATPGADGAPCCLNNRCQPGLVCVPSDPSMGSAACVDATPNRVCRHVCNPTATTADAGVLCPTGQSCSLRFTDTPDNYGACSVTP